MGPTLAPVWRSRSPPADELGNVVGSCPRHIDLLCSRLAISSNSDDPDSRNHAEANTHQIGDWRSSMFALRHFADVVRKRQMLGYSGRRMLGLRISHDRDAAACPWLGLPFEQFMSLRDRSKGANALLRQRIGELGLRGWRSRLTVSNEQGGSSHQHKLAASGLPPPGWPVLTMEEWSAAHARGRRADRARRHREAGRSRTDRPGGCC